MDGRLKQSTLLFYLPAETSSEAESQPTAVTPSLWATVIYLDEQ